MSLANRAWRVAALVIGCLVTVTAGAVAAPATGDSSGARAAPGKDPAILWTFDSGG